MKSTLTYERMARGEIPVVDESDRLAVESLRVADHEFLGKFPWVPARPRSRVVLMRVLPLVAVLVAAVGWGALSSGPDTRAKWAGATLLLYHKTTEGTELVTPGQILAEGDEVQAAYAVAGRRFVALYSVDGRGTVTVHLPLHGGRALEVETGEPALLPYSYRLDDAPSYETFYLVTSPEPFEVARLDPFLVASRGGETVSLPAGFESQALRIAKQE